MNATSQCNTPDITFNEWVLDAIGKLKAHVGKTSDKSIYLYDLIDQSTLYYSGYSVPALLGYSLKHLESLGEFGLANCVHPADLQAIAVHFQRFSALATGEVITVDYRMQRADQSWCLLRSHDTPLMRPEERFPHKILGLVADISVPHLSEIDLLMSDFSLVKAAAQSLKQEVNQLSQNHPY
jgi:hypothetical protein